MPSTFFFSNSPFTLTNTNTVISSFSYNSRTSTLTSVQLGNEVVTIQNNAFLGCTALTSVTLPNSLTSIEQSAFQFCTALTSITIPNSVTSIGNEAFSRCSNLTNVTLPTNNDFTAIRDGAFQFCASLTNITIPSSVTSIGGFAFYECTSMTTITIPNSVTSIGTRTFQGSSLTRVNFLGNAPSLGSLTFDSTNANLKIYRYSTKSGWSSTFGGKDVLLIDTPSKCLRTFGFNGISSGKTSIKKQNTGSGIFSIKKSPKKTYKAFFPIMGNHDYEDINKTGIDYLNYFPFLSKLYGNTSGKSKYYDIKLGPCHFFILDSDPVCGGYFSNGDPTNTTYAAGKGDGNPATTSNATYNAEQKAWYNAAIAASTSKFKFTLFHHPSYDYTRMAYSDGWRHDYADFVLHGHYHNFQRYYEVHNSKQVKYIITGNGGRSLYDFDTNAPNYIFRNNTTYGFTRFDVYENGIRIRHYSLAYQASSFSVIYDETVGTLDVFSFTFAAVADWGKGNGGGTITAPSSLAAHTDFPGNYYINLISQEIRNQNINYIFGVGDLTYVGLTYLYVGYKLNASTPVFIDENIGRFFSDYITDYKGIYSDGKVNSNLLSIGTNSIFYGNQQYEYSI